jgi:vacuole morphology and inheritance protein 14
MTEILLPHILSLDEETQATALRWINEFISMARERMLPFAPLMLNGVLPCLSHSVQGIRIISAQVNTNLFRLVYEFTFSITDILSSNTIDQLNVEETIKVLMRQFQDVHEETRVSALDWLIMLHKNSPKKVMSSDISMVSILLSNLNDQSEEVVKRDLELLAQISHSSDDDYFTDFMFNLLLLFCNDRKLLESRGSLIIRQLSFSLDPERMFCTFAELLEKDEDLEFASIMVQNLNAILITAPELSELRKSLKILKSPDGVSLFKTLYRSWCHNPVALLSLCLLASAYEHAADLLPIFAELEINVALLIQIDKLVQLIESPVFTYLRLQLLEPDKYPHLFKCLYGILMLLPQSSAFVTLRNRLNSVNALATLHATPGVFSQKRCV